ncbi:leucine-rich repeat-containing protein 49-like [Pollicipes pollicipes]|uniref:leucine-rich repeat-containing protein 49-like n=1 Tax=Pollicipes pollicipes TaxID=41117 RepID=UPI001884F523|nr:leucine-rich repeat-containing protein 49-like [Pollicipes pollicipes]
MVTVLDGMRRTPGRRGRSAGGRTIALVGTVDAQGTPADSVPPKDDTTDAVAEKKPRVKVSFDGQGLFSWPETVDQTANLLTLQHNFLSRLPDGLYLPAVVLLDLYDNQLERMGGLRHLETLRVLVLARNRLRKIEGLEHLVHLEILDLHSNHISRLSGLETLARLRVLNVSNNGVRTVSSLHCLSSLQHLNLRGNALRRLAGLEGLPRLIKLNLAHNDIRRPEDIECLINCKQLEELSLNGTAVAAHPGYHPFLYKLKALKILDGMHVERGLEEPPPYGAVPGPPPAPAPPVLQRSRTESSLRGSGGGSVSEEALVAPGCGCGTSVKVVRPITSRYEPQEALRGTDALLEIRDAALAVSGERALRMLTTWDPKEGPQVRSIVFNRLPFDQLAPLFPVLHERFPNAVTFRFGAVRLGTLAQLNALAMLRELHQLTVEPAGNAVTQQPLWRAYAVYRLHHWGLRRLNDADVTAEQTAAADAAFGPLGRLAFCCLPEARLVQTAEQLWFSDVRSKHAEAKPTLQQVQRRLADPRLQGIMEREALFFCPRQQQLSFSTLEESLKSAQRSIRALRQYRGVLPSLLREFSATAVHQRRGGTAASSHEARSLLEEIGRRDDLFS